MKKAIVILSGGPDSTAAALWAIASGLDVSLITFQFRDDEQYGEIYASMRVAEGLKRPHRIIDFKSPIRVFTPNMHIMMHAGVRQMEGDKSKPYLMPFGSGTMLSFAASYALHEGINTIVWGATLDDGSANFEYSKNFSDALAGLISKATGHDFEILVPFEKKHKPEVVAAFSGNPALFASTWSCRKGSVLQCGVCEGCAARRVSADLAGVADETIYQQPNFKTPLSRFKKIGLSELSDSDWTRIKEIVPLNCDDPA